MGKGVSKDIIVHAFLRSAFYKSEGATSLNDIAEQLNVKKASLYNHFDGRDALLDYTIKYCDSYLRSIPLIPTDIRPIVQKHPAPIVLKGVVNRYFKLHEEEKLFFIYTFVQSQKYFYAEVADSALARKRRITTEATDMFNALLEYQKIQTILSSHSMAVLFRTTLEQLLDDYLQEKKINILKNPSTDGKGLFPMPDMSISLKKVFARIDDFVELLQEDSFKTP